MAYKTIVQDFLERVVAGDINEAYARFVHPDFIHHNQFFPGDRQSLLDAMKEAHISQPNKDFHIHQIVEEGDTVMTYSHVQKETMNIAVVHIFRCDAHDMIVEMRDVGQILSETSPNQNGAF